MVVCIKRSLSPYEQFPRVVKQFFCTVDWENTPYCVWDENRPEDCSIASKRVKKHECDHWEEIETPLLYSPDDIWEWLKNNHPLDRGEAAREGER